MNLKKNRIVGLILLVIIVAVAWNHLATQEKTLVVLNCKFAPDKNKGEQDIGSFYKITRRLFDSEPYKLYISNPDYEEKNAPPYLLGVLHENADESDKKQLKIRAYTPPDWHTFIPIQRQGKFFMPDVTYVNRITLQMEDWSLDDGRQWSIKSCAMATEQEFDSDWKTKTESKKKEQKF